ncbi:chemotaxis protein CheW [Fonticella tunisiensis]|uniref:Purine-binding chemotaxis protein CheW n=1 Tax=Fonticella tunisiensis TaxID=1096341 RepID=A0A4R7K9F2_9CLOT|nr:chemotaxis protein CheW [Fonticella tunisiensis]TDT50635.1 purine-binding chemotaxis protein CheW [Fonticella tunisiensis]
MNEKKVVVFKIDEEYFAADIMEVERILGYIEPTRVPDSPDYIVGVIRYQDGILPIMNLRKRLNIGSNEIKNDSKIIVVKNDNKSIGLIVDMVSEVIDISEENIESAPDIVKGISNKYVTGMIKLDRRIIILIDTLSILTKEELNNLETLSQ